MKRNDLDPFLTVFDAPVPASTKGRRDVTNVPGQSLTLLNDPLALHLADLWADRLLGAGHKNATERISDMFRTALGRNPTGEELQRWLTAANEMAGEGALLDDRTVWKELAHTVFNTKEFIYYR